MTGRADKSPVGRLREAHREPAPTTQPRVCPEDGQLKYDALSPEEIEELRAVLDTLQAAISSSSATETQDGERPELRAAFEAFLAATDDYVWNEHDLKLLDSIRVATEALATPTEALATPIPDDRDREVERIAAEHREQNRVDNYGVVRERGKDGRYVDVKECAACHQRWPCDVQKIAGLRASGGARVETPLGARPPGPWTGDPGDYDGDEGR